MIRKLSASGFLAIMALILAFQHPVLGYCGCSHDFYVTECGCSAPAQDTCPCCQEVCEPCPAPRDCCQKISYDPGDILWTPSSGLEPFTGAELAPLPQLEIAALSQASIPSPLIAPPRPPPDSCSLFLRLGVMRL